MIAAMVACVALAGAVAQVPDPVQALAGRYSAHVLNGDVDGRSYASDDVVEVVPVDRRHAYFRIELAFFNGHTCSLSAIGEARGATLDYTAPEGDDFEGCHMTLSRRGAWLHLDDNGGTCQASCGSRGGYAAEGLPWKSKRAIRYLARLRSSAEYRTALAEWHRTR